MSKDGFIYHDEYYELMSELTPAEQSTMLFAMVNFNRTGEEPDFDDRLLRIVWAAISTRMKMDAESYRERCEKNRENAKKRTVANCSDRKRSVAMAADIDTDTDIDTDINNNTITDFDRFWSEYPKKVGKKAAQRAFQVAKRSATVDAMIAAIQKQKNGDQWTKNGGQFVPNPATWLNQRRWDDEIQKPIKARSTLSPSMTHDYDMEELRRRAKE